MKTVHIGMRQNYCDGRRALRAATEMHDLSHNQVDEIRIDRKTAEALLTGLPPEDEPYQSAARFSARYVPLLRPVWEATAHIRAMTLRGITILPHPEEGVTLFATNGRVMAVAHDREGEVSNGGCKLILSTAAMDACIAPKPYELWFDGCREEVGQPPPYVMPGQVMCLGSRLLVMPESHPKGLDDPSNGGALYSAALEKGYAHGGDRCEEPFHWTGLQPKPSAMPDGPQGHAVTACTQMVIAKIMAAADPIQDRDVWDIRQTTTGPAYIPRHRDDLFLMAASAVDPDEEVGIPAWIKTATGQEDT